MEGLGKTLAHGVIGGISSELSGGDFRSGFLAAGFTQGVSLLRGFDNLGDPETLGGRAANAIGAAVVGGTASAIGGGKFANGAVTGAFSRLYNDLKDDLNSRSGPVDQSGRTPRTGNPIDGPFNRPPTTAEKIGDKILDRLFKELTGVGGLITLSPGAIAIPLLTHSKGLGGCDENGVCSDTLPQ